MFWSYSNHSQTIICVLLLWQRYIIIFYLNSNCRRRMKTESCQFWRPGLKTAFDFQSSLLTLDNVQTSLTLHSLNRSLEGSFCHLKHLNQIIHLFIPMVIGNLWKQVNWSFSIEAYGSSAAFMLIYSYALFVILKRSPIGFDTCSEGLKKAIISLLYTQDVKIDRLPSIDFFNSNKGLGYQCL